MIFPDNVMHDFPLCELNTFHMDVSARAYIAVTGIDELEGICRHETLAHMPKLVIGGGSNLLLTGYVDKLVLHMQMKGIFREGEDDEYVYLRAAAGERWQDLVDRCLANGLGGLENLAGIPGTVGAAPVQNIGAYGAELKDCFFSLRAFDFASGKLVEMNRNDCRFSYRDSIFKHEMKDRLVIVDVTFALPKRWTPNIAYGDVARELEKSGISRPSPADIGGVIVKIRRSKLPNPAVLGNAGSFFKNPTVTAEEMASLKRQHPDIPAYEQADGRYRIAAGWLIDRCGWKGRRIGDAGVCETQALVLVNHGRATGAEMVELAGAIEQDVMARFGIRLEPEPVFV